MKIYVVTTGCYSDYSIDRVFTDKAKAEEYAEWLEDSNDVEEYETDDDINFTKMHMVHVELKYHDNGEEELSSYVIKTIDKEKDYTYFSNYHRYSGDYINITLTRYVSNKNFNEDFYKDKYTKAIYDILAIVKDCLANGYDERQINEILNNK